MKQRKLLLVSVFGPYGLQDAWNEPTGMQMELLNNQITREQGVHSPRVRGTHTHGLYLMARNVSVPTVVLDFPSWSAFTAELEKGYTHVGISFIAANALRARRMALHVRRHHPAMKILLGGGGTVLPDLKELVPHDDACRGEGVRWLRAYFGDDVDAPFRGCAFTGKQVHYQYGYRMKSLVTSVFPGIGCPNACDFCHTSHAFQKRYVPFLRTGKEIFDAIRAEEEKHGVQHFMIEDENFLKQEHLARGLLEEMTGKRQAYTFIMFSSADTVVRLGVDFLVRLGVDVIWVGAESSRSEYHKTAGVDTGAVIADLRSHGIKVIASSILFLDHHTKENIMEDVDWAIGLQADLHQFMALSPCPGTALWDRLESQGRIIEGFPINQTSGQDRIWFRHPHFRPDETEEYLKRAFRRNYLVNGPSVVNMAHASALGYQRALEDHRRRRAEGLAWNPETLRYEKAADPAPDELFELRLERMRERCLRYRPILLAAACFAPNQAAREKCRRVSELFARLHGRATAQDRLKSLVVLATACLEAARIRVRKAVGLGEILRQPPEIRMEFQAGSPRMASRAPATS